MFLTHVFARLVVYVLQWVAAYRFSQCLRDVTVLWPLANIKKWRSEENNKIWIQSFILYAEQSSISCSQLLCLRWLKDTLVSEQKPTWLVRIHSCIGTKTNLTGKETQLYRNRNQFVWLKDTVVLEQKPI